MATSFESREQQPSILQDFEHLSSLAQLAGTQTCQQSVSPPGHDTIAEPPITERPQLLANLRQLLTVHTHH